MAVTNQNEALKSLKEWAEFIRKGKLAAVINLTEFIRYAETICLEINRTRLYGKILPRRDLKKYIAAEIFKEAWERRDTDYADLSVNAIDILAARYLEENKISDSVNLLWYGMQKYPINTLLTQRLVGIIKTNPHIISFLPPADSRFHWPDKLSASNADVFYALGDYCYHFAVHRFRPSFTTTKESWLCWEFFGRCLSLDKDHREARVIKMKKKYLQAVHLIKENGDKNKDNPDKASQDGEDRCRRIAEKTGELSQGTAL